MLAKVTSCAVVGLDGAIVVLHPGNFDVDINAVQQGPGDALLVAADHREGAGALLDGIIEVATGAGVHGGDELEVGGKGEGSLRPAGGHRPFV